MKKIEAQDLCFSFSGQELLKNLNFSIDEQEFVTLLGSSGVGKTTLLNLISGHLKPSSGALRVQGRTRRIYQQNGLLPWFNVEQNVLLGLKTTVNSEPQFFNELVDELEIRDVLALFPRQLSGGLRQRVELARALYGRPEILLLDEPFSSIDFVHRRKARQCLMQIRKKYPVTVVMVTHDLSEARTLSDRLLVINGRPVEKVIEHDLQQEMKEQDFLEQVYKELT